MGITQPAAWRTDAGHFGNFVPVVGIYCIGEEGLENVSKREPMAWHAAWSVQGISQKPTIPGLTRFIYIGA